MFCVYCGTTNPDNAKYCHKCGRNIGGVRSAKNVWPPEGTDPEVEKIHESSFERQDQKEAIITRQVIQERPAENATRPKPVTENEKGGLPEAHRPSEKPAEQVQQTAPKNRQFQNEPEQPNRPERLQAEQPEPVPEEPVPEEPVPEEPVPENSAQVSQTTTSSPWAPQRRAERDDVYDAGQYSEYPDDGGQEDMEREYPGGNDGWEDDEEVQMKKPSFLEKIKRKKEVRLAIIVIAICIVVILFALNNLLHFIKF